MNLKAYALFQGKANEEILRKKKEIGGPEGDVEHAVEAEIAREVLNKLIGDEEPHCFGAGVTKSQVSKSSCDIRKMKGDVLTNENRFLLEKVETKKNNQRLKKSNQRLKIRKSRLIKSSQIFKIKKLSRTLSKQKLKVCN